MYSDNDLFTEVRQVIDRALATGLEAPAKWVAQTVLSNHVGIEGEDKDFFVVCANHHVRDTVRAALRRFKPEAGAETDPQLVMPGFDRLQKAYLVERHDEQVVVPIDQLTDAEIDAKAVEYERMAKGCMRHAEELRRYIGSRERAAAE